MSADNLTERAARAKDEALARVRAKVAANTKPIEPAAPIEQRDEEQLDLIGGNPGEPPQPPPDTFDAYVRHGWALTPIKSGEKAPRGNDWNTREKAITNPKRAETLTGAGLLHAFSGTASFDIDNVDLARLWLRERGIDLDALMNAPDAVQIVSGDKSRGKLIYALPTPLPSKQIKSDDKTLMLFELRSGATTGNSAQDVLPPTVNPRTKKQYAWKYSGDGAHWSKLPPLPESLHALWQSMVRPVERTTKVDPSAEVDELRALIADRDSDCAYDEWLRIGMILHHETDGGDDGFALWDEWSAKGNKYQGTADLEGHWNSFGHAPMPATAGSLRREVKATRDQFEDAPLQPEADDVDLDAAEREARAVKFAFVTLDKFAKREPVRYLVDGMIEVGEMFGFIGKRKSGKSYAALDLAFAVAQGREWAKHRVLEPGPVVWIAAEGARSLEIRRGPQWLAHYGAADIRVWPHPLNLRKQETFAGLVDACRGARLVVIDSLRRVTPGAKENSSDELAEVLAYGEQLARETGAAVCFIAHAGKADATTARGSSVIEDQLEAGFAVEKLEGKDAGKFRMTPVFARDEKTGDDVAMFFGLQVIEPEGLAPGVVVSWDVSAPARTADREKAPDWLALTDEVIEQLGNEFTRKAVHDKAEEFANEHFESFTKDALKKGVNRALETRLNGKQRCLQATAFERRNGKETATHFKRLPISGNPDREHVAALLADDGDLL